MKVDISGKKTNRGAPPGSICFPSQIAEASSLVQIKTVFLFQLKQKEIMCSLKQRESLQNKSVMWDIEILRLSVSIKSAIFYTSRQSCR